MSATTLAKIGSTDLTPYLAYPDGYKVAPNKLWTDADRNLEGELKAQLIGIFPKVSLGFKPLTGAEIDTITTLLDAPSFTFYWWDYKSQTLKSGSFYSGDYEVKLLSMGGDLYQPFSVNIIPYKKMT